MMLRVCMFGTYEREYPRNAVRVEALSRAGAEVHECHVPVLESCRHKFGLHRGVKALLLVPRMACAQIALAFKYWRAPAHSLMIVGYAGHLDMPLAWLLSRLSGVPLVFDPLVSLHDTFCNDRKLIGPRSPLGRALWWVDRVSCLIADQVWLDTAEHVAYFARTYRLDPSRLRVVPVGADDRVFRGDPAPQAEPCRPVRVLFVGKFIPLQGIETVLRAAGLLKGRPIAFTVIGSGQQSPLVRRLVAEMGLHHVTLLDWVDYHDLPRHFAAADLCLGTFGTSEKAARVVANKVFQAMASGRAILTADSPAVRSQLSPGVEVAVCRAGDPVDLAREILALAEDGPRRASLAAAGHRAFQRRFSPETLGTTMVEHLGSLIPGLLPADRMVWGSQAEFYGPRHRYREDLLLRAVRRHQPSGTVIDAACGAGSLSRRLAGAGYRVVGVDLSLEFLRHVAGHPSSEELTLVRGDIGHLPLQDGGVDAVVAGEVLEHLHAHDAVVREFFRILRPGGVCAVSVPAEPDQWHWHDDFAGHVRRYRLEELRRLLADAGFEVETIHHFGFPFVKLFHYRVYLPMLRVARTSPRRQGPPKPGRWARPVGAICHLLFQVDRLFNASHRGIGLIALARKPALVANGGWLPAGGTLQGATQPSAALPA